MPFEVETGTGSPTSNSLASVAFADDYVALYATESDAAAWALLGNSAKERKLVRGSAYLQRKYGRRWLTRRVSQTQAMDWPRMWVTDGDGFPIGSDVIPVKIQQATVEAALRLTADDSDLDPDLDTPGTVASESVTVGPISESKSYVGGQSQTPIYRKIDSLVSEFVTAAGYVDRA